MVPGSVSHAGPVHDGARVETCRRWIAEDGPIAAGTNDATPGSEVILFASRGDVAGSLCESPIVRAMIPGYVPPPWRLARALPEPLGAASPSMTPMALASAIRASFASAAPEAYHSAKPHAAQTKVS
jgi:hypothetical protein